MTALACTPAARNCVSMMRRFCIDGVSRHSGSVAAFAQLMELSWEKPLASWVINT